MDKTPATSVPDTDDGDAAPAAKRARLGDDLDWTSAFGKKKVGESSSSSSSSEESGGGGGWQLRNWSEEKRETATQHTAAPAAAPEEDWSFFYQSSSSSSPSTASSTSAPSSSVSETTPASSEASDLAASGNEPVSASSFKVPKGRPLQKRVSFSEEVKVVTIPSRRDKAHAAAAADGDGEFDAEGNPLNVGAGIEELEGGDLALSDDMNDEEEEDTRSTGLQETGAESLIQYLMSSVPSSTQDKAKTKKYFAGGSRAQKTQGSSSSEAESTSIKKRFDKEASAGLDEDSFLDAFIDSDDVSAAPPAEPAPALPESGVGDQPSTEQSKKNKKKSSKPSFKF